MMLCHAATISAFADRSSVFHNGRADDKTIRDNICMCSDEWRNRLEQAVSADGRSLRDISLAAGLSHGYLHGILRDGKEPTLDRFRKICAEMGLSLSYALLGTNMSPATEDIISALEADEKTREAVLSLLNR